MLQTGTKPDMATFLNILRACRTTGDVGQGRLIHERIIRMGLDSDLVIGSTLVDMYLQIGIVDEGCQVFDNLPHRNVVSWGAMISGYVRNGHGFRALYIFEQMQLEGIMPNRVVFLCTLKACSSVGALGQGRLMHDLIIRSGLKSDVVIGNTLIDMYVKCGTLGVARAVFDDMPNRNVVSWNIMIGGYAQDGCDLCALELFEKMQEEGIVPQNVTFLGLMKASGNIGSLRQGRLLHDHILRSGLESDLMIGNALIDMYAKCGSIEDVRTVFDKLANKDVVSWTALILGSSQLGLRFAALEYFKEMLQEGVKPNKITFLCILKVCDDTEFIEQGRLIHELVIRGGLQSDVLVENALIDIYAKCGSLVDARRIFDEMHNRDAASWSAMIAGYAQHGQGHLALELVDRIRHSVKPDKVLFLCSLKACGSIAAIRQGRQVHDQFIRSGLNSDIMVGNTLIDMYAKCGSLQEARKVFDLVPNRDVVSWDAMITGYTEYKHGLPALELFGKMQQGDIKPDKVTFLCILKACGSLGALTQGRLVHDEIMRCGLESDEIIGSSIIDMYAKCGDLKEAHMVFARLLCPGVVSWGAVIAGYVQHEDGLSALEVFKKMQQEGVKPNTVVYTCILKACGTIGAMGLGRLIHEQMVKNVLESDVFLGNTLIDMYARCGSIEEARKVFDQSQNRDVVSWSAMIAGYARYANYAMALQCVEDMQQHGFKPDSVILTNVLAACSHAGLLEEGHYYFKAMKEDHGVTPSIEHYGCMVDLLGRLGFFHEAEDLLQSVPISPDNISWTSLLSGCRTYGNMEMGRRCFDQVVYLDHINASGYVLMLSICAEAHLWKDLNIIQELRKSASGQKKPGRAWIEINGKVHEFIIGGRSHLFSDVIYAKIERISRLLKKIGYVPHLGLVLEPMLDADQKEGTFEPCEKMTRAFGPICTFDHVVAHTLKGLQGCNEYYQKMGRVFLPNCKLYDTNIQVTRCLHTCTNS